MPEPSSLDDYLEAVATARAAHPEWREGQAFFNTLQVMRPDLGQSVVGSAIDPFHLDGNLRPFLDWLDDAW